MNKALLALLGLSAVAAAGDQSRFQCSLGDITRRVEIVYETGVTVPCEVHYYKDTEAPGESQVLWNANHTEGFCEAKVSEFIARLESMGWSCRTGNPASESLDSGEPDDTDALEPAEDIELTESELPPSG